MLAFAVPSFAGKSAPTSTRRNATGFGITLCQAKRWEKLNPYDHFEAFNPETGAKSDTHQIPKDSGHIFMRNNIEKLLLYLKYFSKFLFIRHLFFIRSINLFEFLGKIFSFSLIPT